MKHPFDRIAEPQNLERRVSRFISLFIIPLTLLLICVSLFSALLYIRNITTVYEQTFSYFINEIDSGLNSASTYMAKTSIDDFDFQCLAYGKSKNTSQYELHKRRLYLKLQTDIDYYPTVQNMFLYHPAYQDIMVVPSSAQEYQNIDISHNELKQCLQTLVDEGILPCSSWQLVNIGGEDYLLRLLHYDNIYFGSCVHISALIRKMQEYHLRDCRLDIIQHTDSSCSCTADSLNQLTLPSTTGDFFLQVTMNLSSFLTPYLIAYLLVIVLSVLLLMLIPLSKQYLKRHITHPMQQLSAHMEHIHSGHLDAILDTNFTTTEVNYVAQSLNRMVAQINTMKIQAYEDQVTQKSLEMQCLNLQLNPHFFLNTLNYIYVLSRNDRTEELQQLIVNFSNYFRSIFQSDSDTLTLAEEIERCRNYAKIYAIRTSSSFYVDYDISDDALDCQVPHMCVLTFVENAVKYAQDDICRLRIRIAARTRDTGSGGRWLNLTITDNGIGYSESVLQNLSAMADGHAVGEDGHIGIRNLTQRMVYLYGNQAKLHFYNHPHGGAAVQISLPI